MAHTGKWTDGIDRRIVVSTKLTKEEKMRIEEMRKILRLRSTSEVLRYGLGFLDEMLDMMKLMPPAVDEQKWLLATMSRFAQSVPDNVTPEQMADLVGGHMEELLKSGVASSAETRVAGGSALDDDAPSFNFGRDGD